MQAQRIREWQQLSEVQQKVMKVHKAIWRQEELDPDGPERIWLDRQLLMTPLRRRQAIRSVAIAALRRAGR